MRNVPSLRPFVSLIVGTVISLVFVYLLLRRVNLNAVLSTISMVNLFVLSLSLVTKALAFVCAAWRSQLMISPHADVGLWRLLKSIFVAFAGNNVLPFRIGELMRAHYLARHCRIPYAATLAVIGSERLFDLAINAIIALLVFSVLFSFTIASSMFAIAFAIAVVFLGTIFAARNPTRFLQLATRLARPLGNRISAAMRVKLERFAQGLSALATGKQLSAVFTRTLFQWAAFTASVQIWLIAWDLHLPWYTAFVFLTFVSFGTALPASPGFIGTYHYFAALALTMLGVDANLAAGFALVAHATAILPFSLLTPLVLAGDYARGDLIGLNFRARRPSPAIVGD